MIFFDRKDAGHKLAEQLAEKGTKPSAIAGITKGGVVIASLLAGRLGVPFFALVVKKIPSPQNPELAVGAVAPGGICYIDTKLSDYLQIPDAYLDHQKQILAKSVDLRMKRFGKFRKIPEIAGHHIILTDDGIATGATVRAAIIWANEKKAARVTAVIPVISAEVKKEISVYADEVISIQVPDDLGAVGKYYRHFEQLTDNNVEELLTHLKEVL